MTRYLIAYDLTGDDPDYEALYEELEGQGAKRIQKSVWGLRSDKPATDIYAELKPYLEVGDRLIVIPTVQGAMEGNSEFAWKNV